MKVHVVWDDGQAHIYPAQDGEYPHTTLPVEVPDALYQQYVETRDALHALIQRFPEGEDNPNWQAEIAAWDAAHPVAAADDDGDWDAAVAAWFAEGED